LSAPRQLADVKGRSRQKAFLFNGMSNGFVSW